MPRLQLLFTIINLMYLGSKILARGMHHKGMILPYWHQWAVLFPCWYIRLGKYGPVSHIMYFLQVSCSYIHKWNCMWSHRSATWNRGIECFRLFHNKCVLLVCFVSSVDICTTSSGFQGIKLSWTKLQDNRCYKIVKYKFKIWVKCDLTYIYSFHVQWNQGMDCSVCL